MTGNSVMPWRGRVIHFSSNRSSSVRFAEFADEKLIDREDETYLCRSPNSRYNHLDLLLGNNTGNQALNKPKSILKVTKHHQLIKQEDLPNSLEDFVNPPHFAIEHRAAVIGFVKEMNRVPKFAFHEMFITFTELKWSSKYVEDIVHCLLKEKYLKESLHDNMLYVQPIKFGEKERLELVPYDSGYEVFVEKVCPMKGVLISGTAKKVFRDQTVEMENPSSSKNVEPGKFYIGVVDGELLPFETRTRLRGKCWRIYSFNDNCLRVILEEKIEKCKDANFFNQHQLTFLGRMPLEAEEFKARVEVVRGRKKFVTMVDESLISILKISVLNSHLEVRALLHRSSWLLVVADLENLLEIFDVSLNDFLDDVFDVLVPLPDVLQLVLSEHHISGFENNDYISTRNLACLLDASEHRDDELIRELLLI